MSNDVNEAQKPERVIGSGSSDGSLESRIRDCKDIQFKRPKGPGFLDDSKFPNPGDHVKLSGEPVAGEAFGIQIIRCLLTKIEDQYGWVFPWRIIEDGHEDADWRTVALVYDPVHRRSEAARQTRSAAMSEAVLMHEQTVS
jgi:YD repeat-containing protein